MGVKTRLPLILLVDDSDADNAFHTYVIESYGLAERVHAELTGERALRFLTTHDPPPTLIFLDLNMPGIDGWQFLDRYQTLDARHRAQAVVVMLTTSTDPLDAARAESLETRCFAKPLTEEILDRLVRDLFPHLWQ